MVSTTKHSNHNFLEFVIVISLMMSLTALSIDAMLPALPQIALDLGVQSNNSRQLVISSIFLGLAVGQLFFGPLSDKTGRKPAVFAGYALYIAGALISASAHSFEMLLTGRLIQGIGISAPRAISMAIVRDQYEGRKMAQVMSFVMTVFILVPMLAPTMGQAIMIFTSWRGIFFAFVALGLITAAWFAIRMPESLAPEKRSPFTAKRILDTSLEIFNNRIALGYTISAGLIGGAFLGYLNSAQQIFQDQYSLGEKFPLVFAIISFSIGLASLINTRLVMRFGMRFLIQWALRIMVLLALLASIFSIIMGGNPPLLFVLTYLMLTFFCVGILFGNQNSMAMQPLGHLAGIGSAVVGSLATLIQMPIGTVIGQSYNGTILPLLIGVGTMSLLSIFVVRWAEAGISFQTNR